MSKENYNSEEFVAEKKVEFYVDDKKVDENDSLLKGNFEALHVFCEEKVDLNYSFTTKEKYVEFLKAKGFSENEIFDLTATNEELENKVSFKAATVNPALMTVRTFTDISRTKFLAVFTGNTTLCNQSWVNDILGMQIEAASSACQTGQMPAKITLFDGCNFNGTKVTVDLAKCQSGKKYVYLIGQAHFKNWNKNGIRVSSWSFSN